MNTTNLEPFDTASLSFRKSLFRTGKILLCLVVLLGAVLTYEIIRAFHFMLAPQSYATVDAGANQNVNNAAYPDAQHPDLAGDTSFIQFLTAEEVQTRFKDVGGIKEVKEEVREVVDFLKNPEKFKKMGATLPKGVLLVGPPGTGKTLLARAIAGEARVSFLSVSGAAFQNGWIGTGQTRVRQLFEEARKQSPAIIFIDEIDSLLPHRTFSGMGGDQEYTGTVNQFLAEMDGIDKQKNDNVIVIGASNNINGIDKAALRPGRFDRHVYIAPPTLPEREEILQINFKKVLMDKSINIKNIARSTVGFSGADLKSLVNEAAIYAASSEKLAVDKEALDYAKDKILLGKKRPALVLSEKERKIVAYHEAGHALVGLILKNDPVQKISITPRGGSLGVTMFMPSDDYHLADKKYLEGKIAEALGGRCAESLILGEGNITNGAEDDLKKATEIANEMVTKWGMSNLGLLYQIDSFKQEDVEKEVSIILERNKEIAAKILKENIATLHALAKALLEKETLESADIEAIMRKVNTH